MPYILDYMGCVGVWSEEEDKKQTGHSFAAMCCYDLFVNAAAVLLDARKYRKVRELLDDEYGQRGEQHKSESFGVRLPAASSSVLDFVTISPFMELERLIEAELVIVAFSMAQAAVGSQTKLWLPQLLGGGQAEHVPDFFMNAQSRKGMQRLLDCIQDRGSPRSAVQLKEAILGHLNDMALDNSAGVDVRALKKGLNIANWNLLAP